MKKPIHYYVANGDERLKCLDCNSMYFTERYFKSDKTEDLDKNSLTCTKCKRVKYRFLLLSHDKRLINDETYTAVNLDDGI